MRGWTTSCHGGSGYDVRSSEDRALEMVMGNGYVEVEINPVSTTTKPIYDAPSRRDRVRNEGSGGSQPMDEAVQSKTTSPSRRLGESNGPLAASQSGAMKKSPTTSRTLTLPSPLASVNAVVLADAGALASAISPSLMLRDLLQVTRLLDQRYW
ncbi:hypothetical protein Syun_013016 [Stephania yunnanensis]|uniref:Uncharacterized protein n=1 Tax=Stephania yunnanensis TaxID=152371 RepID=A0AAP0K0K8_9MAGN